MSYGKRFLTESNSGFLDAIFISRENTGLEKEQILLDGYKVRIDKNII